MTQVDTGQWITVQEASRITGRSINSLRLLIRRKKLSRVLKVKGKHGDEWVIHKETVHDLSQTDQGVTAVHDQGSQVNPGDLTQVITLPAEVFLQQQKERDEMMQGMIMYRYKFEELERQMRLLPAPPEVVVSKLDELEEKAAALALAENIIQQAQETHKQYVEAVAELKQKLQEEEHAKEAFRIQWELSQAELKRPWWQKLWKR